MPCWQSTPQPPALNAVGGRAFQWKTRARARTYGTRGVSGPPSGMLALRAWEVRTDAGRSWTPMGGSRPRLLALSFPSSGTRGVTGPVPRAGNGSGAVLALLKYPFYPLFIFDNGMNLISKSLTVLTPA